VMPPIGTRPGARRARASYDGPMGDILRCVLTERSLIPGSTMTLVARGIDASAGERVVVVHRSRDRGVADIGTVARVEESRPAGEGTILLTVTGLHLAGVRRTIGSAEVDPIDLIDPADGVDAHPLVERAAAGLRAYMAARAEAGEGGDVHVTLSRDAVEASNQVASHLRVTWPEIQEILEAGDAHARLRRGSAILERETHLIRAVMGRSDA
jgi:Lon protease-like protein